MSEDKKQMTNGTQLKVASKALEMSSQFIDVGCSSIIFGKVLPKMHFGALCINADPYKIHFEALCINADPSESVLEFSFLIKGLHCSDDFSLHNGERFLCLGGGW